jgi:preprotein translocase subunit SecD
MRKLHIIALILFSLCGCIGKSEHFKININKIGGLFEVSENGKEFILSNKKESYKINTTTYIPFASFDKTFQKEVSDEGSVILNFTLSQSAGLRFKEMTERNIGKPICFVVKDKIIFAPIVIEAISDGKMSIRVSDVNEADEIIKYLDN